jgi:hypothetical protein
LQTSRPVSKVYLVEFIEIQKYVKTRQRAAKTGLQLPTAISPKLLGKMPPSFDTR